MILALVLVIGVMANQDELSKSLGACWLMTIKSINDNTKQMDLLIEKGANKTEIYYKIQTSMIFKCLDKLEDGQGGKYLSDDGAKYTDVVKDFKYEDFKGQSFELSNDDLSLLKVIKTLEKGMGDIQKKKEIEKKAKIGQKVEDQWEKTLNQPRIPKSQDVPILYQIIFLAFIAILFVGGFLLVSYVRKIDNKTTRTKQK